MQNLEHKHPTLPVQIRVARSYQTMLSDIYISDERFLPVSHPRPKGPLTEIDQLNPVYTLADRSSAKTIFVSRSTGRLSNIDFEQSI